MITTAHDSLAEYRERRLFTPAEDADLIALYRRGQPLKIIGAALGRNWGTIQQRVQILMRRGQLDYGTRSRRPWTKSEDAELTGLWGWHAPSFVATRLGRSIIAVQVRAQRLGLTDAWKGAYSARGVGRIFAVDSKTVTHIWIRHGWLRAEKSKIGAGKARRWRIEHEAIEAFILDCVPYYERRRITEPYWRKRADEAWARFDLVSVTVAAKRLGVCPETVKRRIRAGVWPAERVVVGGGHTWMIRRRDLETFSYWHPPVRMVYAKGHSGAVRKADAAMAGGCAIAETERLS